MNPISPWQTTKAKIFCEIIILHMKLRTWDCYKWLLNVRVLDEALSDMWYKYEGLVGFDCQ